MEKNINNLIFIQTIGMVALVLLVSAILVLTLALTYFQTANNRKRPGINIKEL